MKKISLVIIIATLFIYWLLMTFIFNSTVGFSVLTYETPVSFSSNSHSGKLLKGQSIEGRFVAKDKNLGLLFLEFKKPTKTVTYDKEDAILFRIKELGMNKWQYGGTYRSGLINSSPNFPFGFPPISGSLGKQYVFNLTSLKGSEENAVIFDQTRTIVTGYQYSKNELLSNKKSLIMFIIRRNLSFLNGFKNVEFISSSLIYLLPLVLFLFLRNRKCKKRKTQVSLTILLFFIFAYILFTTATNYVVIFELLILFLFLVFKNHIHSNISFLFSLIFLLICISFIFFKFPINQAQEKLSLWAFIFFCTGTVKAFCELIVKKVFFFKA